MHTTLTEEEKNIRDYPSVELAYDLAIQSYDWAHKRWEAADGRIQTFLAFATTVELGLPVVIKTNVPQAQFHSNWFRLAACSFVISSVLGISSRLLQKLKIYDINVYFDKWLEKSIWTFKKDFIYFAGQAFKENQNNLRKKINLAIGMFISFLLGNLLLVIWIIDALR